MGPRGFWIALAIVLFYLIARPHIGTVWYVDPSNARPLHFSGFSGVYKKAPASLEVGSLAIVAGAGGAGQAGAWMLERIV